MRDLRPGRQGALDVARRLFASGGYERTPLRAISDALGVTKAALYHHFKAKDDLLAAVVGPMLDRLDDLLELHKSRFETPEERRLFLRRYAEELTAEPDVSALLLDDPAVRAHAVGRRFAAQHSRMRTLLGGDDDLVAGIRTATALRALELAVVEFGDADPAQVWETALNIAVAVLDTPPAPDEPS